MLFRKKHPRSCRYCVFGTTIDNDQALCTKRGVVSVYYSCRKFKYEPCKRVPTKPKPINFSKYNEEDFSL